MQSTRWKVSRYSLRSFIFVALLYSSLTADPLDNRRFVERGGAAFSDSLISALAIPAATGVVVDSVAGPHGQMLRHQLAACLADRGFSAYLASQPEAGKLLLQSFVESANLDYRSIGSGLFRQGRVLRVYNLAGYGRTLDNSGALTTATSVFSVSVADTLSYEQARAARVPESSFAPALPASLFQRLVEPGIVVSITGALVYLFFASR